MDFNDSSRPGIIQEYFDLLKQQNSGTEVNFSPELTRHQQEELSLTEQDLFLNKQELYNIEKRLSDPPPPFSLDQICIYLPLLIGLDFKKISSLFNSLNRQQSSNQQKLVIIVLLSLILLILLFFKMGRIIIGFLAIFYLIIKFYSARHIYEKECKQTLYKAYQATQKTISAIEQKQQRLIAEIKKLKEIKINSTLLHLQSLESQIKEWLEEDEKQLIKIGLQKLKIASTSEEAQRLESELDREPIIFLIGVTDYEVNKSFIWQDEGVSEYLDNSSQALLIRKEDFYEQKGLDGKYKYGVYEFVSIFLAENFLAYYRCYWNFVRGASVDEETCEYLYDAIVSVKTQERSSLNQKNPNQRRNYKQILSITTMDGKTISFQIGNDSKEKIAPNKPMKNYTSKIDEEAGRIRYWLRKRRVDVQTTKGI